VLGWVLGGVVMTAIPIETVRGEHHYAKFQPPALPATGLLGPGEAAEAMGVTPVEATLKTTLRGPLWLLKDAGGETHVVDAKTGAHVAPLPAKEARFLAGAQYEGKGQPGAPQWLPKPPQEAGRPGPLWAIDFDDAEKTRFYLSPETGEVVSRRSNVWRLYDFFWRIHILDFKDGENFNHPLIIGAAVLTLPVAITGLILLWIRLGRDLKGWRAQRRNARPA
jgi:uncharacterized iron-regulated membrane protein